MEEISDENMKEMLHYGERKYHSGRYDGYTNGYENGYQKGKDDGDRKGYERGILVGLVLGVLSTFSFNIATFYIHRIK
jgi:flagellar biosynthesis/type III secretory pathway protein FliH